MVKAAIARAVARHDVTADQMAAVFGQIMDGAATPAQIGGLLVALRMKGETAEELAGAARAMRARATPLACPFPERGVDTCGTGGDGAGTVNVSTLAAIVAAAAGACVAKHGNRAQSSRSGSADVLEALGVKIDAAPAVVTACMREVGIGFAFAPAFHAATRHAGGPRRELGTRTLFNLLGPMTNPAGVRHQVVGVYDRAWCEPVARALGALGAHRAFVVHGTERDGQGTDEIAVGGTTFVAEWRDGAVTTRTITPADFGLADADAAELAGGDATHNAGIVREVLQGADRAPSRAVRAATIMETALALVAIGVTEDLRDGAQRAADAIDCGAAADTLARWVIASQQEAA
ncbi:MAG: anthranilate phosphoribosyltransferase [Deltaproteobacteria bacterium]|nr:anthranilate phosphoribosyltransferase [Deltaproteobacteria bacterium]